MELSAEIVAEGPVERAFRLCDRPEEQLRWVGSLVEVRVDPERPWGPGATFTQVHEERGARRELRGELLAREPERRIAMRLEHPDVRAEVEIAFEDLGPRCRVRQRTRLELRSLKLKLLRPVVAAAGEARAREDLARLRVLIEAGV